MRKLGVFLVVVVVRFALQYFLSTRETRWLGWILIVHDLLMGMCYAFTTATLPEAVAGFLLPYGIFCAVHILIYRIGRNRVRRRRTDRVEKMNIQDLG